ncbi:Co-chaperonin GroES [Halobacteroides halobius DSM 5150]|uniref:Co-chaperonin GroES n=1 Tax=Halobacteroides halobius (strain ATCC 35273 / DSM 5150 / MD-1) TaxID=748449 RepID=L0K7K4_HALHC|nr:co-chaperone GroES [Halobacteroides halobius]AGB40314.1 Co-chaperonin GroES [Halobacteroides halobius DSM 5150]
MNIKPLGNRVVIKDVEQEEQTTNSGIVIPDSAKEEPQKGEVVAVGEGKRLDNGDLVEPAVNTGDVVIYAKYAGNEIEHAGEEYLVVSEKDILAIIE